MASEEDYENFDDTGPLFPPDLFTWDQRRQGVIILHIIGCLVMCIALFIINNLLLMPSLGALMKEINISPTSSTTFILAAEKSIPKLMISFIGCFMAYNGIGWASLIGASAFNIMITMAMCALIARKVIVLPLLSLLRDVVFLIIAMILLIVFHMDYQMIWWEALIQLIFFAAYASVIFISKFVFPSQNTRDQEVNQAERLELKNQDDIHEKSMPVIASHGDYVLPGIPSKILNFLGKLCLISLLVSLAIMFIICYLLVWWTTTIRETYAIPAETIAIIFISTGTGLPSLVTSIFMTRQGNGVSVVNSCISSSIFDLTVGVGAPALLSNIYYMLAMYVNAEIGCGLLVLLIMFVLIFILILACRGRVFRPLLLLTLPLSLVFVVIFIIFNYNVLICPLAF